MISLWSGLNTTLFNNSTKHYARPRANSYYGNTVWMVSTTDASSYTSGAVDTWTLYLTGETEVGTIEAQGTALVTLSSDAAFLSANSVLFNATSGMALYFTEPSTGVYSLYGQNFTFTASNIGTSNPSVALTGSAQSLLPNLTNLTNWNWDNQGNNFVFAYEQTATGSTNQNIFLQGFSSTGAKVGPLVEVAANIPATEQWGLGTYGSSGYYFTYATTPATYAQITLEDYIPSTGALGSVYNYTVQTSLNTVDVSGLDFHSASWGEMYAIAGTLNGQNYIEVQSRSSSSGPILNDYLYSTSTSTARIFQIKLPDNSGMIVAYQDGSTVDIKQFGTNGAYISSYNFTISGTLYDLTNLGDGRFQLEWNQSGSGGVNTPTTEIFSATSTPVHANDLNHSSTVTIPSITRNGVTVTLNYIDGLNYVASYSDLIKALGSSDGALTAARGDQHFQTYAYNEGRVTTFDGLDYVASYSDLIAAFHNDNATIFQLSDTGAEHYVEYGYAEGRTITFNGLDYIASYSDLIKALGEDNDAGAEHYIENGYNEGRKVTFDGLAYIASYSDLIKALGANEQAGAEHFITNGYYEGRTTTFNGLDYIASYSDLIKALGANSDAGATHYIQNGYYEGRTTTFDGLDYIASYSDLISAFGANEQAGAQNYIGVGFNEGRTTTFDGLAYIANYTDLMHAFGANNDAGATHYIDYGHNEGRTTSFNVSAYLSSHTDLIGRYATADQFLTAYINTYNATGHVLT